MLAPWKKSYDQPRQHIKKQRHYFANKCPSSQTMVFPVVMYGCKCSTIKKTEWWRIVAFQLWCCRSLLHGEGNGTPLQYSCLENPIDGGAWESAVHGVAKGRTRLSDFTFTFHFHALEKEMAAHSSVLAWRIPETVGPGGLPSMGSHRVGHDWSDLAVATFLRAPVLMSFTTSDTCSVYICTIFKFFNFLKITLWWW